MSEFQTKEDFTFLFKNINYKVKLEKKLPDDPSEKYILKNVQGLCKSGEVTAIMGPSGSGKTSLLNFLTDRIEFPKDSEHDGEIYLNSTKIDFQRLSKMSSYVMQDDFFFDVLTPKETLMFVARLRYNYSDEKLEEMVDLLVNNLKLMKCKDTQIGNDLRKGISGGEKKRTSIGIEILSNPHIFFLDEPTSGLDSKTSFIIINFLKELARNNRKAIVFTIHQPSSNIVGLFDRLILVNKGELVYQGPNDGVIDYFAQIGHVLEDKSNPADAFIHKMEFLNGQKDETLQKEFKTRLQGIVESEISEVIKSGKMSDIGEKNLNSSGFVKALPILMKRAGMNILRNPMMLRIRLIIVLIFSFFACSIFSFLQNNYLGGYNRTGFFFFFSINNFMQQIFSTISTFPVERAVFLREYASNLYGVMPYFVGKTLVETPVGLLITCLYSLIVYYIIGLRSEPEHYFIFVLIYVGIAFLAQGMGLLFGCAFNNFNTAMIITQFSLMPIFLFSGFLINQSNMPVWLAWIRFLSPFRYVIEAAIRNEFEGVPASKFGGYTPIQALNLDIGMWNCIIIIYCMGVGYRILANFFLKMLVRKVG